MKTHLPRIAFAVLLFLLVGAGHICTTAAEPQPEQAPLFVIQDGQRVLFLGDSITYGDSYVQYFEAFLYTRYPNWQVTVLNRGIPSETCAGTSEPSHDPPRPDVHTRFDRTVPPLKPDLVFLCFGMNDGIYHSPNPELQQKYEAGMTRLVQRVRETGATPIVLTPPPFDYRPFAGKQRPADLKQPDYRFPAADYDQALAAFAAWEMTQRDEGLKIRVIDLHSALADVLKSRCATQDDFRLAADGIHPGATGHWLMAQTILTGLNAPRVAGLAEVDLSKQTGSAGISKVTASAEGGEFTWLTGLPLPIDPSIDAQVLKLADSRKQLGEFALKITGLPKGKYALKAGGKVFATATETELAAGLDLAGNADFPLNGVSLDALRLIQQRRIVLREVWIKADPHPRLASEHDKLLKTSKASEEQAAELDRQIRQLCQPQEVTITVERVGKK